MRQCNEVGRGELKIKYKCWRCRCKFNDLMQKGGNRQLSLSPLSIMPSASIPHSVPLRLTSYHRIYFRIADALGSGGLSIAGYHTMIYSDLCFQVRRLPWNNLPIRVGPECRGPPLCAIFSSNTSPRRNRHVCSLKDSEQVAASFQIAYSQAKGNPFFHQRLLPLRPIGISVAFSRPARARSSESVSHYSCTGLTTCICSRPIYG